MSRKITLPEPFRSLAAKLGSVQALADALGVTTRTLNRWAKGEHPMGGPAQKLYQILLEALR